MEIITFHIDRRALMVLALLLLLIALLSSLQEIKRKKMCRAIMQRQDELEKGLLNTAMLSLLAVEKQIETQPGAKPKKTVPARRK